MALVTPTDKGSLIAGVGISCLAWLSLFKLDYLAKLCHLDRWISQEEVLNWIVKNKTVSLLITEVLNFGIHGITRADSVLFALGSTVVNAVSIFVILPLRQKIRREKVAVLEV